MRRLEAMAPFKEGLRVIGREARLDPMAHLIAFGNLDRATAWLVDASEAGLTGFKARAARRVLMLVYARTFGVWLDDTTPDLANTLAELDKRLQQVEQLGRWVARARRRASGRPAAEPGAEPSPVVASRPRATAAEINQKWFWLRSGAIVSWQAIRMIMPVSGGEQ